MQACIQVCPKNPANFNVDNVRVAKLLGGGLHNSTIVRGMVLKTDAIGSIKRTEKAKVSYYFCISISLSYSGSVCLFISELQIFTFTLPLCYFLPLGRSMLVLFYKVYFGFFPHLSFLERIKLLYGSYMMVRGFTFLK